MIDLSRRYETVAKVDGHIAFGVHGALFDTQKMRFPRFILRNRRNYIVRSPYVPILVEYEGVFICRGFVLCEYDFLAKAMSLC